MPVVCVKCSSDGCFPFSTSMYNGQFPKLTVLCCFCLAHHAGEPGPLLDWVLGLATVAPFTPQAARNAPTPSAPAPAPADLSRLRRDTRPCVRPRHIAGSMWSPACSGCELC